MTGMLASVNSVEEALLALAANVDIIDLKQPALGALGALETDLVKTIVAKINGRCPVSATVGDLPMQPEIVYPAVKAMVETGVDYVKIGFFPGDDWEGTLDKLATLPREMVAPVPHRLAAYTPSLAITEPAPGRFSAYTPSLAINLIAVLFADAQVDFAVIDLLKDAGFKGVMLDTMNKSNGSLTQVMSKTDLAKFVKLAKDRSLLCGLAGSLRLGDIAELMPYQSDYLGFRGALCLAHNRTAQLDKSSIIRIKQAMDHHQNLPKTEKRI